MFSINATLIVQMLNFVVAYLIIRFYILKPTVAVIQREDSLRASLREELAERRHTIETKQRELSIHWQNSKEFFAQHIPIISYHKEFLAGRAPLACAPLHEKDAREQVALVAAAVVKQVDHVR